MAHSITDQVPYCRQARHAPPVPQESRWRGLLVISLDSLDAILILTMVANGWARNRVLSTEVCFKATLDNSERRDVDARAKIS